MIDLSVRNLTLSDIDLIKQCIYKHDSMYGIAINHDEYVNRYLNSIKNSYAVGAFLNDECLGIVSQQFWETMPIWTMTNLFLMTSDNSFYSKKMIKVTGALMEQCIRNAESHERYEFYYLLRDTEKLSRKSQTRDIISKSNSYISNRYDFINIHMIKSLEDVKWKYISNLLGDIGIRAISFPNNKTLAIRRVTIKSEFRLL